MNRGPAHLREYYARRKRETAALIKAAIGHLKTHNRPVSYASIREAVIELSGGARRISESTIMRNAGARQLYLKSSTSRPRNQHLIAKRYLVSLPEVERSAEQKSINSLRKKSRIDLAILVRQGELQTQKLENELSHLREIILNKQMSSVTSSGARSRKPR